MKGYKAYLLGVLLLILAFNQVDRLALGLVLQDIKSEFDLSDVQAGLLSGIAFALFYSLMGIPIARWADRADRVVIISATTALWSVAAGISGMVGSYLQLLFVRIGVAVGEAGCVPPAHSLIADYFNRAERPRAVAIYLLGIPLSAIVGFFLAGWLNELYGWRTTFVVLSVPGMALALLAILTIKEPRREFRAANPRAAGEASAPSLMEVCRALWINATFRRLLFCFAVVTFFAVGLGKWLPSFFVRSYGLQTGELGTWLTLVYGVGGVVGTYWGGELASRWAAGDERVQLKAMGVAYIALALISTMVYLVSHYWLAFALQALTVVVSAATGGPLFALVQTLVPARMRATAIALILFSANLIGAGLGPLAVGFLSDTLVPYAGQDSLRYALMCLCPGYLWAAWQLSRAAESVANDVRASRSLECAAAEELRG